MTAHFVNLLDDLQRRSLRMGSSVEDMLLETCEAVTNVDHSLARRIIKRDDDIDQEEVAIEAEVLRLMTLFQPMGSDMRQLCTILKVNNDLERVADCAVNVAERVRHLGVDAMENSRKTLSEIYPMVRSMLHEAIIAYATANDEIAAKVRSRDETIDAFYGEFIKDTVALAGQTPTDMNALLDVLSIAKNMERVADLASNICEDVIYLVTGRIIRHNRS